MCPAGTTPNPARRANIVIVVDCSPNMPLDAFMQVCEIVQFFFYLFRKPFNIFKCISIHNVVVQLVGAGSIHNFTTAFYVNTTVSTNTLSFAFVCLDQIAAKVIVPIADCPAFCARAPRLLVVHIFC
jgi:hypothetical protein